MRPLHGDLRRAIIAVVLAVLRTGATVAQEQEPARFDTTVGMTRVKAAVIGPDGEPLEGLRSGDFRLWEDDVEREINLVLDPVRFSLDIALVLDFSESIRRDWSATAARAAAHDFLERLGRDDCVFLLPFSSSVGPGVWGAPGDVPLLQAIDEAPFEGATRLYDAMLIAHDALDRRRPDSASAARQELDETLYGTWMEPIEDASCGEPLDPEEALTRRSAMVVLTDGEDYGSSAGYGDALMASWRSEVPVFAMAVGLAAQSAGYRGSPRSARPSRLSRRQLENIANLQDQLREIARVSGGQLVVQRDLAEGYAATLGLLRGYYVLAYDSPQPFEEGWHDLEVQLVGHKADVVVQPGVFRSAGSYMGAVNALREASVKFGLGQYEDALADLDLVARFSPDIGAPFFGRGLVLERMGRFAEARESFERSLQLRPGAVATHAKLADVTRELGDYAAAWEHGIRSHKGGFSQVELFEFLDGVSTAPEDLRTRLEGPVVYITRPLVPELESQLALQDLVRFLAAELDASPPIALTATPQFANFSLSVWVRGVSDDGKLTARLVVQDLATRSESQEALGIDDLGDPEMMRAVTTRALDEIRAWILERHARDRKDR